MDLGMIIQLISGAVGGNIAGSLMKNASMGTVLNSVIGILGGGLGGQLLGMLGIGGAAAAGGGMDIAAIIGQDVYKRQVLLRFKNQHPFVGNAVVFTIQQALF